MRHDVAVQVREGFAEGRAKVRQPRQGRGIAEAWFEAAYRDHHQAVTAAARRLCGPDHAADVAHEVFDALWRHPDVFDPERGSLRAFLTAVARHKAIDVLRQETALRGREDRTVTWQSQPHISMDDNLVRDETATRIRAALNHLPPAEREAITTAFYSGCTYRQAAARLGEPEGTTKSRIRSGLHRLRPHLADLDDAPGLNRQSPPRRMSGRAGADPEGQVLGPDGVVIREGARLRISGETKPADRTRRNMWHTSSGEGTPITPAGGRGKPTQRMS